MVQNGTVGPNRDLLLLTKENPLVSLEAASEENKLSYRYTYLYLSLGRHGSR